MTMTQTFDVSELFLSIQFFENLESKNKRPGAFNRGNTVSGLMHCWCNIPPHEVQNAPTGALPDMAIVRRMGWCCVPIFPKIPCEPPPHPVV